MSDDLTARLTARLDLRRHVLVLTRRWKVNDIVYNVDFASIALTAQAETLVQRAMEADLEGSDCWLLAAGTEFSDPAFKGPKRPSERMPYIDL